MKFSEKRFFTTRLQDLALRTVLIAILGPTVFMSAPARAESAAAPLTISPSTLAQYSKQNLCSLSIRKKSNSEFPVFYCFRNETDTNGKRHCALRQIDIAQGIKPYFGLPGVKSIDDVVQVDGTCEKGGVDRVLQAQVDDDRVVLAWLATSPLAGGNVESFATYPKLARSNYPALFNSQMILQSRAATPRFIPAATENQDSNKTYVSVPVFFGTDRNFIPSQAAENTFDDKRTPDGKLKLGIAQVTIPKQTRATLSDLNVFKVVHNNDPSKEVNVSSLQLVAEGDFYGAMKAKVNGSSEKDLFVFIHGYNVTFGGGLRSAAQLAYDLNFKGAAVLYSWPAATLTTYPVAENNVDWTNRHLIWFLNDIVKQSGAKNIYLIAHSMGNRAAVNALDQIANQNILPQGTFRQVVLAAPDIDNDYFHDREKSIRSLTSGLTVYASEGDWALKASRTLHEYPRLGDGVDAAKLCPGMDSIDANHVVPVGLGHSYITENIDVVGDLRALLAGKPVAQRDHIRPASTSAGPYWNMMP